MQSSQFNHQTNSSLDLFFHPRSIAIIGAGQSSGKPNGLTLYLLDSFGFEGKVYPVNPKYDQVSGYKCYPTVVDITEDVDLAVVTVPEVVVMKCLEDCARKNIKNVIIFSSGYAETGEEGKKKQEEMKKMAQELGLRILGPNCLGLHNYNIGNMSSFFYHPQDSYLYPNFFSFITQSGGIGQIIYQLMVQYGIGFNYFVSTGNEVDVSYSEILDYLVDKEDVSVVGGYLEGLSRDGQLFVRACEKALNNKTLLTFLKVGRTQIGAEAASSHTGSMVGADRVYDAVFRQKGVVRVDEMEQMNILLSIYAAGKLPRGNRVGIVSISGGGGVVLADRCPEFGLDVVNLSEKTKKALDEFFPTYGSTSNPVDLTSKILFSPELVTRAIRLVVEDPGVDVGLFSYNLEIPIPGATEALIEVYKTLKKPLLIVSWPTPNNFAMDQKKELINNGIPVVESISCGLWALSALSRWVKKTEEAEIKPIMLSSDKVNSNDNMDKARDILRKCSGALTESLSKGLLSQYGIPVTKEILVSSINEAEKAAAEIGYPVVMKIESPDILHKSDAGGVYLNLESVDDVKSAYEKIIRNARSYKCDARIDGVLVQEMLEPGLEVIVGIKNDPIFGPIIVFGLGGIFVEVLEDISMRLAPLTKEDAEELIKEIKGYSVLMGTRGQAPRDVDALVDILMKLSDFALDMKDIIGEMDINPLIVYEKGKGAVAADALIIRS